MHLFTTKIVYANAIYLYQWSCEEAYFVCYFVAVPIPHSVIPTAPDTQLVSQPLILDCGVNTVRGIVSRVDITWSVDGLVIEAMTGINATILSDNSALYSASVFIPELNTDDENKPYQCEVVINSSPPVTAARNVTLDVTGKHYLHCYASIFTDI